MKPRDRDLTIVMGILVGASLGGGLALILLRRSKQASGFSFRELSWRDLIRLVGPLVALVRQLLEMSSKGMPKPDKL